ncbi:MAG: hypothetical protein ABSA26_05650 [Thermoguttaceae bacterium]
MKKLLILTSVAILLSGAAGCRIADWWRRPAYQSQCPPTVMYSTPCTTVSDCNSCGCCAAPAATTVP